MKQLERIKTVLKGIFGTDEQMQHPRVIEETRKEFRAKQIPPENLTSEDTSDKIREVEQKIEEMRASTRRLTELPAKSIDDALHQITRSDR